MNIKNNINKDIFIEDLQLKIPFKESIDLTELGFSLEELDSSIKLKDLIYSKDLLVNDNISNLSVDAALKQISLSVVEGKKDLNLSLMGGESNQVLSKASKTDFDFKWINL